MQKILIIKSILAMWIFIFMVVSFFVFVNPPFLCWDGMNTDEAKLMGDCNVTSEEFWEEVRVDKNFCPKGYESFSPTGGCEPDYSLAFNMWLPIFVIWTIVLVIFALIYFKIK